MYKHVLRFKTSVKQLKLEMLRYLTYSLRKAFIRWLLLEFRSYCFKWFFLSKKGKGLTTDQDFLGVGQNNLSQEKVGVGGEGFSLHFPENEGYGMFCKVLNHPF